MNSFEMEKISNYIAKCRKYIPKDKKNEWDDFVLRAKLKNMNTGKGLGRVVEVAEMIVAIEKGKKEGIEMSEIIKQPFKYYLLVNKFSRYGAEYLKCYVEKYGNQENTDEENG